MLREKGRVEGKEEVEGWKTGWKRRSRRGREEKVDGVKGWIK